MNVGTVFAATIAQVYGCRVRIEYNEQFIFQANNKPSLPSGEYPMPTFKPTMVRESFRSWGDVFCHWNMCVGGKAF